MNKTQNIHIGSIIKAKLSEKSMTIADFARKINRERATVYNIFERKSVDTDLLIQISKALDYDFISEVYCPQNTKDASRKILIAIEIEEDKIETLDLPETFIRILRQ